MIMETGSCLLSRQTPTSLHFTSLSLPLFTSQSPRFLPPRFRIETPLPWLLPLVFVHRELNLTFSSAPLRHRIDVLTASHSNPAANGRLNKHSLAAGTHSRQL
jgi:hypothetical protein